MRCPSRPRTIWSGPSRASPRAGGSAASDRGLTMSFIWPTLLFSLITLVPLVALYIGVQRRRRDLIARYGSMGMVQAAGRPIGWRRHLPPALFFVALALLLFSLARPQTTVSLPRIEG